MGLVRPIQEYIDALVHPSVQHDALAAARHRAFIAPRILASMVALAALPIYLAMRGMPSTLEIIIFAWLIVPALTAYYLSGTGRYESAHVLSSLALTVLVTIVAAKTGGITSFAAIWLVVVPLEAALSASRRVVAVASTLALGAAGLLLLFSNNELLPEQVSTVSQAPLAALGIISAALYATGLALGAESLTRMSFWMFYTEEDRYRLLARNMTDVITRHGPNGAVIFASPAAETLFGVGVGELLGHGLFDRVHVADRPAYLTAFAETLSRDEAQSVEFRVRRDGDNDADMTMRVRHVWIEMRCRPFDGIKGDNSAASREIVAVMRDITERKVHEHGLQDARSEAERANAAKTHFLATVSHELRTPLNVIIGFSEMLFNEQTMQLDAERRADYAKLINDSGHHLLAVVNGILDMSKIDSGEFIIRTEPFDPAAVIRHCLDLLALKAGEAGLELKAELPAELPEMIADKRALKQILLNLLSNAIKFTDRGGRVVVSARTEAGTVIIAVEDNGIGIEADDIPHLGDPFFQARGSYDRPHDGTGLGLSIVKGLVTLHAGTMDIASRPGQGTRVTLRLPIDCEHARMRAQNSKLAHQVLTELVVKPARPEQPARMKESA